MCSTFRFLLSPLCQTENRVITRSSTLQITQKNTQNKVTEKLSVVIFSLIPLLFLGEAFSHQHGGKSCPIFFSAKWNFCPHLAPDECSCPTLVLFLGLGQASQSHAAA